MKKFLSLLVIMGISISSFTTIASAAKRFPDVEEHHQYANEINYIVDNSFAGGFTDGTFKPENKITRAELTKIVVNAKFETSQIDSCMSDFLYGTFEPTGEEMRVFPDVALDNKFTKYICIAKNFDIVKGYQNGEYRPENEVTFGEASKIIMRTLDENHEIDNQADLVEYINRLSEKSSVPPTLNNDKDVVVNRGEVAFLIQIINDNYTKLSIEPSTPESIFYSAVIKTNLGDIEIDLHYDKTPNTVNNFKDLAERDFYDETIFHRVIEGFMIQGGDPTGTGSGGPGYTFNDEFHPELSNAKGTISMANSGPDTNGSQFFINTVDNTFLDYNKAPTTSAHTVFGEITNGMEVIDTISKVQTGAQDKPITDIVIEDIIIMTIMP